MCQLINDYFSFFNGKIKASYIQIGILYVSLWVDSYIFDHFIWKLSFNSNAKSWIYLMTFLCLNSNYILSNLMSKQNIYNLVNFLPSPSPSVSLSFSTSVSKALSILLLSWILENLPSFCRLTFLYILAILKHFYKFWILEMSFLSNHDGSGNNWLACPCTHLYSTHSHITEK